MGIASFSSIIAASALLVSVMNFIEIQKIKKSLGGRDKK